MGESWIRRRQMEQRTQQILHSALELFYEKGIDDTSIEEVAVILRLRRSLQYRWELFTGRRLRTSISA